MTEESKLTCTFCTKHADEVQKLIAGPQVYICDECIFLCYAVLSGNAIKPTYSEEYKPVTEEFSLYLSDDKDDRIGKIELSRWSGMTDEQFKLVTDSLRMIRIMLSTAEGPDELGLAS
jgi:hypothetical protein